MQKTFFFAIIFFLNFSMFSQGFDETEKYNYLNEHNIHRKIVGSPPLQWSETLEIEAQKQANLIAANFYSADINDKYGVNIYRSATEPVSKDVLYFWVQEQKYYHGKPLTQKSLMTVGHYTQVIWSQTTYIGCAISQTVGGVYVVVCFYDPKGNTIGQKP